MNPDNIYEYCPKCNSTNVQQLDKDSLFCLECDWDNLNEITAGNDELLTSLLHGDIHSRRIAAQSLINTGDVDRHLASPTDIITLQKALDDEDSDVRYFVAVALGKLDAKECLNRLKQLAQDDSSALVREGAQTAIQQIESHMEKE